MILRNQQFLDTQGRCTYEFTETVAAWVRPTQAQARQISQHEGGDLIAAGDGEVYQ